MPLGGKKLGCQLSKNIPEPYQQAHTRLDTAREEKITWENGIPEEEAKTNGKKEKKSPPPTSSI